MRAPAALGDIREKGGKLGGGGVGAAGKERRGGAEDERRVGRTGSGRGSGGGRRRGGEEPGEGAGLVAVEEELSAMVGFPGDRYQVGENVSVLAFICYSTLPYVQRERDRNDARESRHTQAVGVGDPKYKELYMVHTWTVQIQFNTFRTAQPGCICNAWLLAS